MRRTAFTLIELLVVIAIIGVLAALLMGAITRIRFQSRSLDTQHRIGAITQALTSISKDEQGAAFSIHRDVIFPGLNDGVVTFQVSTSGERGAGTRSPRIGTWIDPTKPHLFSFPWGAKGWDLTTGAEMAAQPRHLGQLTPTLTTALLRYVDLIPDEAAWLSNRGLKQAWNDAWGNPLVIGTGLYQPPANSAITSTTFGAALGTVVRADHHLRLAEQQFAYVRACYFAVGAAGEQLQTPLSGVAATDMANLWSQVTTVCHADQWSEASFASAPWSGVRIERVSGAASFLSAPLEVR